MKGVLFSNGRYTKGVPIVEVSYANGVFSANNGIYIKGKGTDIKGKGTDLGAEPPSIKFFLVPPGKKPFFSKSFVDFRASFSFFSNFFYRLPVKSFTIIIFLKSFSCF